PNHGPRSIHREPADQGTGLEALAGNELPGDQRILRGGEVVRGGRYEHSRSALLGREKQDALDRSLRAGRGQLVDPFGCAAISGETAGPASAPPSPATAAVGTRLPV